MSIRYHQQTHTFHLDALNFSYIMKVYDEGYLLCLYSGVPVQDDNFALFEKRFPNASFSPANPVITENGFSPDTAPIEYGCNGAGDFRVSALSVRNVNGDSATDLRYVSHRIYQGKTAMNGLPSTYIEQNNEADTLEIIMKDFVTDVIVTLVYTVFNDAPVITKRVIVKNESMHEIKLERAFSLCTDFPTMDYDLITLPGRWSKERSFERRPLAHGVQGVESRRGVSGHTQNPFVAFVDRNATEDYGNAFGFNFVYSGNFSALAECDVNNTTRFVMGINPVDFCWYLGANECFETPEAVMLFSNEGLGGMSRAFHRFYNKHLIRGKWKTEKRPLLINSWEAAFFDINTDKLVEFARVAKKLGMELLVMDDGWFGKRNDDTCSLGDWFVNTDKFPGGLSELVCKVNQEGMKFGIWFEPEMISPDSDLFRKHPDWHVHVKSRETMIGRNQYVLDVSRKDVRDYIWQQIYDVLSQNNIEYLKWDFNRNIADAASAALPENRQTKFFHRFNLGTYDLMDRLVRTFPNILFENCSGGGGRFDPAMLCYSPQIWCSDNTDAFERLSIQYGTSMVYPASAMGAHVSANPRTGYETKCNVAQWGTFGFELDPRKLTEDDCNTIRNHIEDYHRFYNLIRNGDLYRLVSPFENRYRCAWEFVSQDKLTALFTLVTVRQENQGHIIVKLKGLLPEKMYRCEENNEVFSGAYLMNAGLVLSSVSTGDGESYRLVFTAIT